MPSEHPVSFSYTAASLRLELVRVAQRRPALDLDDGVKVNYLKLGEALVPIAGLAAKEDE